MLKLNCCCDGRDWCMRSICSTKPTFELHSSKQQKFDQRSAKFCATKDQGGIQECKGMLGNVREQLNGFAIPQCEYRGLKCVKRQIIYTVHLPYGARGYLTACVALTFPYIPCVREYLPGPDLTLGRFRE